MNIDQLDLTGDRHDLTIVAEMRESRASRWTLTTGVQDFDRLASGYESLGSAAVNPLTGDYLLTHSIGFDASGGDSEIPLPGLVYDSTTVGSRNVIYGRIRGAAGSDQPIQINARLRWYDHRANKVVYTDKTFEIPDGYNGEDLLIAIRPDSPPVESGVYRWELDATLEFDSSVLYPEPALSLADASIHTLSTYGQSVVVVNQSVSQTEIDTHRSVPNIPIFGDGWSLAGVPLLIADPQFNVTNSPSRDDRIIVSFPGESPRVFRNETSSNSAYNYGQNAFIAIDPNTGLDVKDEWGTLKPVESSGNIILTQPDGTIYTFERFETSDASSKPDLVWKISKIGVRSAKYRSAAGSHD